MKIFIRVRVHTLFTVATLALYLLAPAHSHAQDTPPETTGDAAQPKLAVIVSYTGQADAETARDLQEILIAAFSGRGNFEIIGKEEVLALTKGTEQELTTCLIQPACADKLRAEHTMRYMVLGKIDSNPTHHEFSIERFSDIPEPYTRVVKVLHDEGVNGLLDALYTIAGEMPLDDKPNVVIKTVEVAAPPPSLLGVRLTPRLGALILRQDTLTSPSAALEISYTLPLGEPEELPLIGDRLRVALEAGFQTLSQESTTIVGGRGRTNLVQNSQLIPIHLSLIYTAPADWIVQPYAGVGGATLLAFTDAEAFSQTRSATDIIFGIVAMAGLQYPIDLYPTLRGHLTLEAQHRELTSDLTGAFGAEGTAVSGTGAMLGFGVEF